MRIHWGMGRFWAIFFASVRLVRNVLWEGCGGGARVRGVVASLSRGACVRRSADPRWGRRDATTGGAFLASVGPRSAVIGCGARKSGEFVQLQLCVLR